MGFSPIFVDFRGPPGAKTRITFKRSIFSAVPNAPSRQGHSEERAGAINSPDRARFGHNRESKLKKGGFWPLAGPKTGLAARKVIA